MYYASVESDSQLDNRARYSGYAQVSNEAHSASDSAKSGNTSRTEDIQKTEIKLFIVLLDKLDTVLLGVIGICGSLVLIYGS